MKRFAMAALAGTAALLIGGLAAAQDVATPKDLPPTTQAVAWIDNDPAVIEAQRALAAAGHGAAALAAGTHEWTVRAAAQQRRVRENGNSNEWAAQLERAVRIGGKAEIDRQLGDAELAIGRARVGEARHETARALADLWLGWLAAGRASTLAKEQLAFAEANLAAVDKRRRAGDASTLDLNVATADLAELRRQASHAESTLAKARAKLRVRFPGAPNEPPPLSDPAEPVWTESQWRIRIVEQADALKVGEGQLSKAQRAAERARADKLPDPTLGVYTAYENFGNERIIGLSINIPLAGSYRDERMRQALQEVEVARAALDRERQAIDTEVAETHADAVGAVERWRLAERGAEAARENAGLMQRAYALGEAELQALLLVRRQALDASRAALEARAEALRWSYRLLIDAHLIWDLAHD